MESKIEKLERVKPMSLMGMMGEVAPQWVAKELNKIIDHLNSQDQEEERKSICDKHHREICRECMHNGNWTFEDTPEQEEEWVEKLWELIDVYRDSKDINSELERIEEVNQYVKQLLSEREREVLETIKELVDGKSIYSNNGCGTPLELIEWFVDTELDKLNKKK